MGWTHHWNRAVELNSERFATAVRDCKRLIEQTDVDIAGFEGIGESIFESEHIVFNGASPNTCEPFEIARVEFDRRGRDRTFGNCKTEHLPYDICVQSCLVILTHYLKGDIEVSSDGGRNDWNDAIELVHSHLGYGHEFQLNED